MALLTNRFELSGFHCIKTACPSLDAQQLSGWIIPSEEQESQKSGCTFDEDGDYFFAYESVTVGPSGVVHDGPALLVQHAVRRKRALVTRLA